MYSPDGRWWWNGAQWVPVQPAQAYRTRYEETPWTRKLQLAVIALLALGLVGGAITVPLVLGPILGNTAFNDPAFNSDPQAAQFFRNVITASIAVGVILTVASLGVIVVGVIRLWRWVYWYVMINYFLAILSLPGNLTYVFGNAPIRLPAWILLVQLPLSLAELALAIWMVIALRRYGPWARRKIVEPAQPAPLGAC